MTLARDRAALTALWLGALVVSLVLVEAYVWRTDAAGIRMLLPEDRTDCVKPLLVLYGGYLGGILAFWFMKPFKRPKNDRARRLRFWIALACTAIFNAVVLYAVGYRHLMTGGAGTVQDDVKFAGQAALWLAFIVGPVNFYYFGMKKPS